MRKWISIPLAACAIVVGSVAAETSAPVEARVTNCWHHDYYNYAQGNCMGRDSNPPYTTQFALMMQCSNGMVTSGWKPAPNWTAAYVQCVGSGRRVGSTWFVFK